MFLPMRHTVIDSDADQLERRLIWIVGVMAIADRLRERPRVEVAADTYPRVENVIRINKLCLREQLAGIARRISVINEQNHAVGCRHDVICSPNSPPPEPCSGWRGRLGCSAIECHVEISVVRYYPPWVLRDASLSAVPSCGGEWCSRSRWRRSRGLVPSLGLPPRKGTEGLSATSIPQARCFVKHLTGSCSLDDDVSEQVSNDQTKSRLGYIGSAGSHKVKRAKRDSDGSPSHGRGRRQERVPPHVEELGR